MTADMPTMGLRGELGSKGQHSFPPLPEHTEPFSEWLLPPVSDAGYHLGPGNLCQTRWIARAGGDRAAVFRALPPTWQRDELNHLKAHS